MSHRLGRAVNYPLVRLRREWRNGPVGPGDERRAEAPHQRGLVPISPVITHIVVEFALLDWVLAITAVLEGTDDTLQSGGISVYRAPRLVVLNLKIGLVPKTETTS